ncbi:MAG: hypothetical protein HWE34_06560 [Methylocystaceae bacterium]|nr:hypothetical protein [Methylocystaceae bacterium]
MEKIQDLPKVILESSFLQNAHDDPLILILIVGTIIALSLGFLLKFSFVNMRKADQKKLTEFEDNLKK